MIDLRQGDCIEIMSALPDSSVDMILCDPPYGTTACKWDAVIPFDPMWREVRRVLKKGGAAVFSRREGTLAVGERIAQHKLTEDQVKEIRASTLSSIALARLYPVQARQIRRIRSRELWKHV